MVILCQVLHLATDYASLFIEKLSKVGLEGILIIPLPKTESVALSFCRQFDKLHSP